MTLRPPHIAQLGMKSAPLCCAPPKKRRHAHTFQVEVGSKSGNERDLCPDGAYLPCAPQPASCSSPCPPLPPQCLRIKGGAGDAAITQEITDLMKGEKLSESAIKVFHPIPCCSPPFYPPTLPLLLSSSHAIWIFFSDFPLSSPHPILINPHSTHSRRRGNPLLPEQQLLHNHGHLNPICRRLVNVLIA